MIGTKAKAETGGAEVVLGVMVEEDLRCRFRTAVERIWDAGSGLLWRGSEMQVQDCCEEDLRCRFRTAVERI